MKNKGKGKDKDKTHVNIAAIILNLFGITRWIVLGGSRTRIGRFRISRLGGRMRKVRRKLIRARLLWMISPTGVKISRIGLSS